MLWRLLHVDFRLILLIILLPTLVLLSMDDACGEGAFSTGYKDGFYIRSEKMDEMELLFGGLLQTDYRYYFEEERADNRFDIRRARLRFNGQLTRYFRFKMEYQFEGAVSDQLLDAYGEGVFGGSALRLGQFKEPFSLEWQSAIKSQYFAERSMGYFLGPKRDIGLMLHGGIFQDVVNYGVGLFNGDGIDGSASGPEADAPEAAGRVTFSPFKGSPSLWLNGLQLGVSATYAEIDPINVNLRVKSTGMAGTLRNLYALTHNTKFGVVQDVHSRYRYGLEGAWAVGPVMLQGEYFNLTYTDLEASGDNPADAEFASWYVSAAWWLTGERPVLSEGRAQPVHPNRLFNPQQGTWGAFCLAARFEQFNGDENWINPASFVSVAQADSISLAANWVLYPMVRIIIDYTYTDLSDPVRTRVLPDGSADYIDEENVLTCRFSIDF